MIRQPSGSRRARSDTRSGGEVDDVTGIALARQRVQPVGIAPDGRWVLEADELARQIRAEADAHHDAGADPYYVAGLRAAAVLVRDGRPRPSEAG